ncbi:MAG: 23S rRNA (guanosine(2251)-2'-O)-methyltransferase RlmB [Clostridia bacterium]|nr:23S rRNA (guanosine(2251)-2'-O)-methyltransferase RlmB [Oscillospiraceae bacterium]MBR4893552.1 23S rRNA (guanosine(2251)-2'-O)-methyltransferase RlmB [Clostridia bacterium]
MDKIYGRNPVSELIKSGGDIDKIYVNKELIDGSLRGILNKAKDRKIIISYCTREKLDEMCETTKHQGIMALVPQTEYVEISDILDYAQKKGEPPFIFILDEIEDPHNLGAIIRTANVCGAHGVIIPKRRSATVNATVAKASAGAVSTTLIARVNNITNAINELKKNNVWVYGMEADGDKMYYEHDLKGSIAIVVGSEGFGMSDLVRKSCDFTVKIPVMGTVNSLNASVATGVVAFEALRQRLI